ncbi:MAG: hypothetical protein HYS45_00875 [Parcubacteria group bacterium]|nr:hypothetical protein [Parcubacteria group bacterium]
MIRGIIIVFSRWRYAALAAFVALGLFLFVVWLPNRELLGFALSSETISFWRLVWKSPQFFAANETRTSAFIALAVIILSAANIAMLAYYLKWRIRTQRGMGVGIAGTMVGLVGIGCTACGSIILSSIFGFGAVASFLGVLPFGGLEFGAIGIVALLFSIRLLSLRVQNLEQCAVPTRATKNPPR